MRGQFGFLGHDGAVQIDQLETCRTHAAHGFGQQYDGAGTVKLRIRIGKMATNIAQGGRAQHGIGDGVQEHIGIRMPQQAVAMGHGHTAQQQGATWDEGMHIPAFADA